jgi:hypothetical protein
MREHEIRTVDVAWRSSCFSGDKCRLIGVPGSVCGDPIVQQELCSSGNCLVGSPGGQRVEYDARIVETTTGKSLIRILTVCEKVDSGTIRPPRRGVGCQSAKNCGDVPLNAAGLKNAGTVPSHSHAAPFQMPDLEKQWAEADRRRDADHRKLSHDDNDAEPKAIPSGSSAESPLAQHPSFAKNPPPSPTLAATLETPYTSELPL